MSKFAKMFDEVINEGSTAEFFAVLKEPLGNLIPASAISSMSLTFFDVASGDIVNSRNGQDVLNVNNAKIDEFGTFRWSLQPEDTAILNQALDYETHRAEFVVVYTEFDGGDGQLVFDADFYIRNLTKFTG